MLLLRRLMVWLFVLVVALGVLRELALPLMSDELAARVKHLRHFSPNGEHNLPTWFTAVIMALAALLSALMWRLERARGGSLAGYWAGLALIMLLMSVDEAVSFHEAFVTIFAFMGAWSPWLHFAWVVPGMLLVLIVGLIYLRFLWRLPRPVALYLLASGLIFLSGALVLEMVDGWVLRTWGEDSVQYTIGYVFEDTLEMIGIMLFNFTVMDLLRQHGSEDPRQTA